MTVHDLDTFAQHNGAEDGKEAEDCGECGFAVDDEEGDVVDFEAVGEVAHACAALVGVRDDYDFVAAVDEFLRHVLIFASWTDPLRRAITYAGELVDVRFDASCFNGQYDVSSNMYHSRHTWLRIEEIANHTRYLLSESFECIRSNPSTYAMLNVILSTQTSFQLAENVLALHIHLIMFTCFAR